MVDGSRQMIATWPAPPGPHHRQMTIVPPPGAGTADWATGTVPRPLIVDSATAILQVLLHLKNFFFIITKVNY